MSVVSIVEKLNCIASKCDYHNYERKKASFGSKEYKEHYTKELYYHYKHQKIRGNQKFSNKTNRELFKLAEDETKKIVDPKRFENTAKIAGFKNGERIYNYQGKNYTLDQLKKIK